MTDRELDLRDGCAQLSISVIMPVYNGAEFLRRSLEALACSTVKPSEVIVVDDCSTDNSIDVCRERGVRVLSTPRNSGPAVARNLAARVATGNVLLFVDADVLVKPETVGQMAALFEKRPEVSAVFGSYDDEPGEKNFLSQYKNLQHHYVHQISNPEAATFWSGLGAIRREVFLEFGGFDDKKFDTPSIEDIELGFRLRRSGHRIILDRSIQAKHLKKWGAASHMRTEIFSRALPWSKLILETNGMINDMNLRVRDRLSAIFVALIIVSVPFVPFFPALVPVILAFLVTIAYLNWGILRFFAAKRGIFFAVHAFFWQLLYFFYSGATFAFCWFSYTFTHAFAAKNE
jgi:glycosyltransferase involved in cell wall biosynthesis